jgi:hypothetical protein
MCTPKYTGQEESSQYLQRMAPFGTLYYWAANHDVAPLLTVILD